MAEPKEPANDPKPEEPKAKEPEAPPEESKAEATQPEEEPTEPDEEIEPEEEDTEGLAPTVVYDYMPSLADNWGDLSEQAQTAILEDIARQIDSGAKGSEAGEGGTKGQAQEPAKPAQTGQTPKEPAASPTGSPTPEERGGRPAEPPEGVSDQELQAACAEFGIDATSDAAKFLRKLIQRGNYAVETSVKVASASHDLGTAVLKDRDDTRAEIEKLGKSVMSLTDENELVDAIEAHTRDFAGIKRKEYERVVSRTREIKQAGRTDNWQDAVSLALLERQKIVPAPQKLAGKLKRDAEKVASTLSTGKRGTARGVPKLPPGLKRPSDIMKHLHEHSSR